MFFLHVFYIYNLTFGYVCVGPRHFAVILCVRRSRAHFIIRSVNDLMVIKAHRICSGVLLLFV